MTKLKELISLYLSFFKLGLFTFGGGYSMISLISNEFVDKKKYISDQELLDIVAIAESTPGPIAINTATFIGNKRAGLIGGIIATLGTITPSIIIICLIASIYDKLIAIELVNKALKGIIATVIVLITFSSVKLAKGLKNSGLLIVNIALILLTIIVKLFTKLNSILMIIIGIITGIVIYCLIIPNKSKKEVKE